MGAIEPSGAADPARPAAFGAAAPADPSFEILFKDLAVDFVRAAPDEVDAEIERWLQRIVEALDADRSSISEWTATGFTVTHCWARSPIKRWTLGRNETNLPNLAAKVRRGEVYAFSSLDQIPPDHVEELAIAKRDGVLSHISVPMVVSGRFVGLMGVAYMRRECAWVGEVIRRIELVVTVLGNALARRREAIEHRQTVEALAHAERVATMSQLASSFAHDLNQPLAASLTNAQSALRLLAANPPDLDEVRSALEDIVADNRRAGDIVRELRGYLRKQRSTAETVDLEGLMSSIARFTLPEARRRGIDLRVEVVPGLPPASIDRVQVQQAVVNLLLNAFQALADLPAGRRAVVVAVGEAHAGRIPLSVGDAGPGVPEALRERVFAPFASTKPDGIGLGLAICRNIAEAHGGTLDYAPSALGGAQFTFSVPVANRP